MDTKNCKWYFRDKDGSYIQYEGEVVYFENIAEAQFFLNQDELIEKEDRDSIMITLEKPEWYEHPEYGEIEAKESLWQNYREAVRTANTLARVLDRFEKMKEEEK